MGTFVHHTDRNNFERILSSGSTILRSNLFRKARVGEKVSLHTVIEEDRYTRTYKVLCGRIARVFRDAIEIEVEPL